MINGGLNMDDLDEEASSGIKKSWGDGEKTEQTVSEQITEVKDQQVSFDHDLNEIVEGVGLLNLQVMTLNQRVYTKNYLDRIRNWLFLGLIVVFITVGGILGILIHHQNISDREDAKRALLARRQIADCTVRPGEVLEDGYINPGKCFLDAQERTKQYLEKLTTDITASVSELLEAQNTTAAINSALFNEIKRIAQSEAERAKTNQTTSTTLARMMSTSTVTTTTIPPEKNSSSGVLCFILSIVGLCDF